MKNTSIALDKLDEWFKIAKPGDIAFHFDTYASLYYLYIYAEADDKPYWHLFHDVETAQEYLDAHFGNKEEPKMNKRCENCKHWHSAGVNLSFCKQDNQAGILVPKFTCCDKHEPKEERSTPFDNLKFYLKDASTGELDIKYICEDCGKVEDRPFHWWFALPIYTNGKPTKKPGFHFRCEACEKKARENKK